MSTERFYLSQNTIGCYLICDRQRAIPPLPRQRYGFCKKWLAQKCPVTVSSQLLFQCYGFCKKWLAQKYVNDLNAGIETPESLYTVWNAGNRRMR